MDFVNGVAQRDCAAARDGRATAVTAEWVAMMGIGASVKVRPHLQQNQSDRRSN